jgi:hypothetical protein
VEEKDQQQMRNRITSGRKEWADRWKKQIDKREDDRKQIAI